MTQPEQLSALEHGLAEVAVALFAPGTVERVLQRIVDEAAATIEACDFAGVLHLHDGQVTTAAHNDPRVLELHRLQADLHQGPCFDVVAGGADTYAADLAHDDRWPDFGPAAVAEGVRSVLAYQVISARSSALDLYSPLPAAFGVVDRATALLFATLAGLAIASAEAREDEQRRAVDFQAGLRSRELIGQAQGILMERERITSAEAFDVLVKASQHLNLKLRDVAQTLVDTGETGDTRG